MSSWPQVARADVLRRRLAVQRLTTPGPARAAEVVDLLACVQSQEWAHGFWSLGMRTGPGPAGDLDQAAVQAEFDRGDLLRTHVLRPTWHYVTPADIGWMLAATSARVHQRNQGGYRQTGLDPATRDRAAAVFLAALADGAALTRTELAEHLAAEGLGSSGLRLAAVVMAAELDGLIASGPLRISPGGGAQHTYRRLDELLAGRSVRRPEDPVAELLGRFLAGHGPASVADFARWCSLTLTDARAALERLREQHGDRLIGAQVADGPDASVVWWFADAPDPRPATGLAFLVPLYDELTLSYPKINFDTTDGHPHRPGTDLFVGSVILDEPGSAPVNAGLWQRTISGRRVGIGLDLATGTTAAGTAAARDTAAALARFLGKDLDELVE